MKKIIYLFTCIALIVGGILFSNNVVNSKSELSIADLGQTAYAQQEQYQKEWMLIYLFCENTVYCHVGSETVVKREYGGYYDCVEVDDGNVICNTTICDAKKPKC